MNSVLSSPEIAKDMMRALQETPGDIFFYTGHTARVYTEKAKKNSTKQTLKNLLFDDYSKAGLQSYDYENLEHK